MTGGQVHPRRALGRGRRRRRLGAIRCLWALVQLHPLQRVRKSSGEVQGSVSMRPIAPQVHASAVAATRVQTPASFYVL